MIDILVFLIAMALGGLVTLYLIKNNPELLQKWIDKIKEKANKL